MGRAVTPAQLGDLVGAPPGSRVRVASRSSDEFRIYLNGPGYEATRTVTRKANGDLVIHNDEFRTQKTGTGLGLSIFAGQVETAAKLGVARIDTYAARGPTWNGYWTWPRFGYDGPIPARNVPNLPPSLAGATRMSDLFRTKEGRDWWSKNGQSLDLIFDLTEGSLSRKVLAAYQAEKAALTAGPQIPK